jgi:hypothetical protein
MKFSVRLLFVIFLFLISLFVLRPVAFAQTTTQTSQLQQNQPYLSTNTNSDVPRNLHTWTQTVLIEVISASSCAITGIDPTNPNQACLGLDQKTGKIGYIQNGGGAIGMLTSSMAMLYNPPIHTGDYISYLSNSFGLTKPTYAAAGTMGTGFQQLSPVMYIWIAFRNIAYMFFIIIFLVIGVAIMLRVRIDPRTVMTIQNQIPKIIIGVVMVTFSFAIAGFLIDLMWTSMYVSFGVLSTVPGPNGVGVVNLTGLDPQTMQANTPIGVINSLSYATNGYGPGVAGIANQISITLKNAVQSSLGIQGCPDPLSCLNNLFNPLNFIFNSNEANVVNIVFNVISGIMGMSMAYKVANLSEGALTSIPVIGSILGGVSGIAAGAAAGTVMYATTQFILREVLPWLIIFLVVYIAMFWALLRLWFELIKAFIFVLFDVIFAPFWIMASLIPGNTSVNISSWIKDLVGNLAAFPAAAAMFMLGKILMDAFAGSKTGPYFVPPLVGNPNDTNFLGAIVGLAVILSTPQVVTMVKKAIKAPEVKLGAFGAAIGAGAGIPTRAGKTTAGIYTATKYNISGEARQAGTSIGGIMTRIFR